MKPGLKPDPIPTVVGYTCFIGSSYRSTNQHIHALHSYVLQLPQLLLVAVQSLCHQAASFMVLQRRAHRMFAMRLPDV